MERRKLDDDEVVRDKDDLTGRGAEVSLSVDDTNRLRISLGLPPLAVKSPAEIAAERAAEEKARDQALKRAEEERLRTDLAKRRNKRLLHAKVAGLSLGEELKTTEAGSSAAAWVERSRLLSKHEAGKLAQQLDQQDTLFQQEENDSYDSRHLAGLKVRHTAEQLTEGVSVILTLKDQTILEQDDLNTKEDELENIALKEDERVEKNKQLKKQTKAYDVFDESVPELLKQYNEDKEQEGMRLPSLDPQQNDKQKRLAAIRARLQKKPEGEGQANGTDEKKGEEKKEKKVVYDLNTEKIFGSDYEIKQTTFKKKKLRKKKNK